MSLNNSTFFVPYAKMTDKPAIGFASPRRYPGAGLLLSGIIFQTAFMPYCFTNPAILSIFELKI